MPKSTQDASLLHELVSRAGDLWPDAAALTHGTGSWSFQQVAQAVRVVSAGFVDLGLSLI